ALGYHFQTGVQAARTAEASERLAALGSLSVLVTLGLVTVYNVFNLIYLALIAPFTGAFDRVLRDRRSRRIEHFNSRELQRILENLPLFSYFTGELLRTIISRSELREFKSRTPVILQGDL